MKILENRFQQELKKIKKEWKDKRSQNSIKKGINKYYTDKNAIQRIYKKIIASSNIPPKYENVSFKTFRFDAAPQENIKKVKKIKSYAENILTALKGPQSIYLFSYYNGSGKTHIAVSALKTAAWQFAKQKYKSNPLKYKRRGTSLNDFNYRPVFFMSEVNYLWKARKFNSNNQELQKEVALIEKAVINSDLLVIDDFFKERDTDFVFGNLKAWLNLRYDNNKPVIFTSNDDFKILALENDKNPYYHTRHFADATYLSSRISEMTKGYQFAFKSSQDYDYRQTGY